MFKSKEKDVFVKILSHTTIWDGGKKERSDGTIMCYRRIVTNFIQCCGNHQSQRPITIQ